MDNGQTCRSEYARCNGRNLVVFQGWASLADVILKNAAYFLQMYRLLVTLEEVVQPRPEPKPSSETGGLAGLGTRIFPVSRTPVLSNIEKEIAELSELSGELGLSRTKSRLKWFRQYIDYNRTRFQVMLDLRGDAQMQSEIRVLTQAFMDDLEDRLVFFPDMSKVTEYMGKIGEHLDEDMHAAFPGIDRDFIGATRCYYTDNFSASVFHSMRVAEFGLRGLAHKILHYKKKQLPNLQWGPIIRDLGKRIDEMHEPKKKPSANRKQLLDFLGDARAQCVYFKGIRDDTMHTRGHYEQPDALKALTHIEDFIRLLVKNGISLPPDRSAFDGSPFQINIKLSNPKDAS